MDWRMLGVFACALLFPRVAPAQAPRPEPRPVVLMLEGIGGLNLFHVSGEVGFGAANLPHEVRQFSWSHGFGKWMRDLQDFRHLLARSEELAQEIQAIRKENPSRRVYLVAHSGGTGVAIRAAELLPADSIDRIILLSSALSPCYDLRPALRASRGGIISYHSRHDYFFLHWGTRNFGTIDRYYQVSAGYAGFVPPSNPTAEDRQLYARLVQIPWSPRMLWQGNPGTHVGPVMPSFLAGDVAHWLR